MYDKILVETQYLPPIELFCAIVSASEVEIEIHENWQKQTYRNRCYILGANKVQSLNIPIVKPSGKVLTKNIAIDHSQNWNTLHWRTIQSAYGKSAFFEYFVDHFEPLYSNPPTLLYEFNQSLLTLCLKLLGVSLKSDFTKTYVQTSNEDTSDIRSVITPKKNFEDRPFYQPVTYHQVFGKDFAPNLSILDLLMNEGPQARSIVTKSIKQG